MKKFLQQARRRYNRLKEGFQPNEYAQRYIDFNRKKFPRDYPADRNSVVLLGLTEVNASIYSHAYVANYLARKTGSVIDAYGFREGRYPTLLKIYESFGVRHRLSLAQAKKDRAEVEKQTDTILAGLQTKWDVLAIAVDGLRLGDIIYDTYLRFKEVPTMRIDDPRFREILFQCLMIYRATINYLRGKKVVAFLADDYPYCECGIPLRVVQSRGVPVYAVNFGAKFFIHQMRDGRAVGHSHPIQFPYHDYPQIFAQKTPQDQAICRERGREFLEGRLAGKRDHFTLQAITAFGEHGTRIFPENDKPRMLVFLHDFIDAPHGFYRSMIFADFYEWIYFLLEKAADTPFEWYLKPHPIALLPGRQAVERINTEVSQELARRFPKAHFLPATTSNSQLVAEGVSALFTVHGTAGHEFAKMGVPVVNAGDNPHIAYPFNYHPKTVAEYAEYIRTADQLKPEINTDEIHEWVYMHYFHFAEEGGNGANPMDPKLFEDPAFEFLLNGPTAWDQFMACCNPQRDAELEAFFDDYFREIPARSTTAG